MRRGRGFIVTRESGGVGKHFHDLSDSHEEEEASTERNT